MQIKVGDVFRCKRRGHEVIVHAVIADADGIPEAVYYRNIRGALIQISASRLLNASRFERMAIEALKTPPSENELPVETQQALNQTAPV